MALPTAWSATQFFVAVQSQSSAITSLALKTMACDISAIAHAFAEIRRRNEPLDVVEETAGGIARELGFKTQDEAVRYLTIDSDQPPAVSPVSDSEMLLSMKQSSLGLMLQALPSDAELKEAVSEYMTAAAAATVAAAAAADTADASEEQLERVIAGWSQARSPSILPMTDTPIPVTSRRKYKRGLPRQYDASALVQRCNEIMSQSSAGGGDTAKLREEAEKAEAEMAAMAKQAADYWERVLTLVTRLRLAEDHRKREEVALLEEQRAETARVTNEAVAYIATLKPSLLLLPILIAEGYRYMTNASTTTAESSGLARSGVAEGDSRIRHAVNDTLSRLTCRSDVDFYAMLSDIMRLPRDVDAVTSAITALQVPCLTPNYITMIARRPKREQLVMVTACMIYSSL